MEADRLRSLGLRRAFNNEGGRLITLRGALVLAVLTAPLMFFQVGSADFDVYRHGASVLVHGASLYIPGFADHPGSHLPFTYPPFAAIAFLVLLPLPAAVGAEAWGAATVLMLAWCVSVSFQPLLQRKPRRADLILAVLTAILVCTRPAFDNLGDGQIDILLMTLCLADTVTPRPWWPRGLLIGVATAIKLVPGIFIPYLWITGRRRAAAVAAGAFIACTSIAGLVDFHGSRLYWTKLVFNTERPGYTAGYKNQSLRGVLLRVLPAPGRTSLLVALALLIAIIGLIRARRATSQGHLLVGATLTGLTGLLASPVSWIHAAVWTIPAIGVLVDRLARPVRVGIAVLVVVALIGGLPYVPNGVHGLPYLVVVLLQRSFGIICLGLALTLADPDQKTPVGARASTTAMVLLR